MDIDINNIQIQCEWPIIARIKDEEYEYQGYDHLRYTARGLCENEEGKFAFLHIKGEDLFGLRDHLETIGGGVEENEKYDEAMLREIGEETGFKVKKIELIGSVLDTYNLIGRITFSTFFHCLLDTADTVKTKRTEEEEILISEILWYDPLEALDILEHHGINRCDRLVQKRDAAALRYYLENYTKLLK